jgi:ribonuclease P protein component
MKTYSIRSRNLFNETLKNGTKVLTGSVIVLYIKKPVAEGEAAQLGIGIITSKKTFGKAVDRNFVKRRIRAAIRQVASAIPSIPTNIDIVCIGRKRLATGKFADFVKELNTAVNNILVV